MARTNPTKRKRQAHRKGGRTATKVTDDVLRSLEVSATDTIACIFLLLCVGASIASCYILTANPGCLGLEVPEEKGSLRKNGDPTDPTTGPPRTIRGIDECTEPQMEIIKKQLPAETCTGAKYSNGCSFSKATTSGCRDPFYMREFYASKETDQFSALVYNCNEDLNYALDVLHMGSHDPLFQHSELGATCSRDIKPTAAVTKKIQLYCIEPTPSKANDVKAWIHDKGLSAAVRAARTSSLIAPDLTLNQLLAPHEASKEPAKSPFHVMRIISSDGKDYSRIMGAMNILHRVRYLEFGYHYQGDWEKPGLMQELVDSKLKEKGFACYWHGGDGNLWRITGCWQESYNSGWWSNVVCVNASHDDTQELLKTMEQIFKATLQKTQTFGV